jgi:zinc transporter, ZIP family
MGAAFGWGTLAACSLVIGALVALWFKISLRAIGLIMGFGAGVLISAVAFDLVEEAAGKSSGQGAVAAGIFAGCLVFFGGDLLISRFGGSDRKDASGAQGSGSALAIVLGSVLDGIPESMVIGLTIFQGGAVGAAYLVAVFISNLPSRSPRRPVSSPAAGRSRESCGCGSGSHWSPDSPRSPAMAYSNTPHLAR